MRTLLGIVLSISMWAATATKDKGPGPEWGSMPNESVTAPEVTAAPPPPPADSKAPSLAEAISKPAEPKPEAMVDLFPPPLLIAIGLAVVAMVAYIAVARLT